MRAHPVDACAYGEQINKLMDVYTYRANFVGSNNRNISDLLAPLNEKIEL